MRRARLRSGFVSALLLCWCLGGRAQEALRPEIRAFAEKDFGIMRDIGRRIQSRLRFDCTFVPRRGSRSRTSRPSSRGVCDLRDSLSNRNP